MHRVGLAALSVAVITATSSAWGYDLQYRQNNTALSAAQLQQAFNRGLPSAYDQLFPQPVGCTAGASRQHLWIGHGSQQPADPDAALRV